MLSPNKYRIKEYITKKGGHAFRMQVRVLLFFWVSLQYESHLIIDSLPGHRHYYTVEPYFGGWVRIFGVVDTRSKKILREMHEKAMWHRGLKIANKKRIARKIGANKTKYHKYP